jgi:hypothetical protein
LVLTIQESRKFNQLVKNKATGTPLGMFIYNPHWLLSKDNIPLKAHNVIIGVGLSALLVSTNWAMREPLNRGTSIRAGSTLFVYMCT